MGEILNDFQAIQSVIEHQKKEFSYLIPKPLMDRVMELLEMHQPHEPIWDKSILNPDDYVRIGDIQELLSDKNGFCLDDTAVFHAVGLITWAMGKRSISKEELLKDADKTFGEMVGEAFRKQIDLMKEIELQVPKVLSVDDMQAVEEGQFLWIEIRNECLYCMEAVQVCRGSEKVTEISINAPNYIYEIKMCDYNIKWRRWDSQPTLELMEAMPWESKEPTPARPAKHA